MESNFDSIGAKILIIFTCICAGVFSVAIALATQYIKVRGVSKKIIIYSLILQCVLSMGVFIFVILFFNSNFLPEFISNDIWSMLTTAYFAASIPEIIITATLVVFSKEVNKWLKERYGNDELLPVRGFESVRKTNEANLADFEPKMSQNSTNLADSSPKMPQNGGAIEDSSIAGEMQGKGD